MIVKNAQAVADKETGCDYMFQHSRLAELKLIYRIFARNANNSNKETKEIITKKMQPYIV